MKLNEHVELELKVLEQQHRFYLMINGIMAAGVFIAIGIALVKLVLWVAS